MTAKNTKTRPTIAERAIEKVCPGCGGSIIKEKRRGRPSLFCSSECQKDFQYRTSIEGRAIIAFVKAWRIDRGTGEIAKGCFAEICTIADRFNAADREAGRPRADLYAAKMLATGFASIDRLRK